MYYIVTTLQNDVRPKFRSDKAKAKTFQWHIIIKERRINAVLLTFDGCKIICKIIWAMDLIQEKEVRS